MNGIETKFPGGSGTRRDVLIEPWYGSFETSSNFLYIKQFIHGKFSRTSAGSSVGNFFVVFVGGGIGAAARYWLSGTIARTSGSSFPYGTITVNVVGCFLIGLLMTSFEDRFLVTPSLRLFLTIGILGGFTTFSTFSFETIAMLRDAEFFYAALNVLLSVMMCLAATYAGTVVGKYI
jgi:fluoride exporter